MMENQITVEPLRISILIRATRHPLSLRFNASLAAEASRHAVALREGWLAKEATLQRGEASFPRNLAPVSVLYIGERPEMTPKAFGAKEGQNNKGTWI